MQYLIFLPIGFIVGYILFFILLAISKKNNKRTNYESLDNNFPCYSKTWENCKNCKSKCYKYPYI